MASISAFRVEKLVIGLFSRSTPRMGHLPPFDFWRSWCSSVNVVLMRLLMRIIVLLDAFVEVTV